MAAVGPVTSLLEQGAAAVGAGALLGGFAVGFFLGLLLCRRGAGLDRGVMMAGYAGGAVGLLAFTFDGLIG